MSEPLLTRSVDGALLTVAEVASALRVTEVTVRRYIAAGALPSIRLGAGDTAPLRVRSADLARFLMEARRRQVERRERVAR
jgi:excisionase family DNA binding protein